MKSFFLVGIELYLDHSLLSSDRAGVLFSVFNDVPDNGRVLSLRGHVAATGHVWLQRPWPVANVTKELNFKFSLAQVQVSW